MVCVSECVCVEKFNKKCEKMKKYENEMTKKTVEIESKSDCIIIIVF